MNSIPPTMWTFWLFDLWVLTLAATAVIVYGFIIVVMACIDQVIKISKKVGK